jgi:hypothetical protein
VGASVQHLGLPAPDLLELPVAQLSSRHSVLLHWAPPKTLTSSMVMFCTHLMARQFLQVLVRCNPHYAQGTLAS